MPADETTTDSPKPPVKTGRSLRGVVASRSGTQSVTVVVKRLVKHPLYLKRLNREKKYHAHDENNEYSPGETVMIEESAPTSKKKAWKVIKKISYDTTANKT
ncbi:30S ribosomal protein S17 [Patescibacteria group bacterium]|nr:30S ribosomal protein S17 [Patescibacteria group bacterium]